MQKVLRLFSDVQSCFGYTQLNLAYRMNTRRKELENGGVPLLQSLTDHQTVAEMVFSAWALQSCRNEWRWTSVYITQRKSVVCIIVGHLRIGEGWEVRVLIGRVVGVLRVTGSTLTHRSAPF